LKDPELRRRYPALEGWFGAFLHEDFHDEWPTLTALVDQSFGEFARDRARCVEDIRRFRLEFPTPRAQVEAAKRLGSYYNGDSDVFAAALDQLELGLVEEIETGVSRRTSLDDD
jgi:hypothetical protein